MKRVAATKPIIEPFVDDPALAKTAVAAADDVITGTSLLTVVADVATTTTGCKVVTGAAVVVDTTGTAVVAGTQEAAGFATRVIGEQVCWFPVNS